MYTNKNRVDRKLTHRGSRKVISAVYFVLGGDAQKRSGLSPLPSFVCTQFSWACNADQYSFLSE